MNITTLIFDLDETLMVESVSVKNAFEQACEPAVRKHSVSAVHLAEAIQHHGRELWHQSPVYPWCLKIGISSWDGLSGNFAGDGKELSKLRDWIVQSQFRATTWLQGLADFDVKDKDLANYLARHLVEVRQKHHVVYPDTQDVLEALRCSYRLALLTNGAPRVQHAKLESTGLEKFFDNVLISGEIGLGKPDTKVFELTLNRLGVQASEAVMIGDGLRNDIGGAKEAGICNIWVNRADKALIDGFVPDHEVSDLTELLGLLQNMHN